MDDSISRQSAIDVVSEECQEWRGIFERCKEKLLALPSVQPEIRYYGQFEIKDPILISEQQWIPVSERLPEKKRKTYWVCTDTEYQCECRWTNNRFGFGESDNWGWSIFDTPQYTKVTAWMPLPEPWKEGEADGNQH